MCGRTLCKEIVLQMIMFLFFLRHHGFSEVKNTLSKWQHFWSNSTKIKKKQLSNNMNRRILEVKNKWAVEVFKGLQILMSEKPQSEPSIS